MLKSVWMPRGVAQRSRLCQAHTGGDGNGLHPELLKQVPLFALLDADEVAVLAGQVEDRKFVPRQRIYKIGDPGGRVYIVVSGKVQVTTVDEDGQEVIVDESGPGDFFGFASMLEQ